MTRAARAMVFLLLTVALISCEQRSGAGGQPAADRRAPLVEAPSPCGGCDATCFVSRDVPTQADLVEGVSDGLVFSEDLDAVVAAADSGSYTRLFDSQMTCFGSMTPFWSQIYFEAEAPAGTSASFLVRCGDSLDEVATDSPLTVSGDSPFDLSADPSCEGRRYLQVTAELQSSGDRDASFRSFDVVHYCLCSCDLDGECSMGCHCDEDC